MITAYSDAGFSARTHRATLAALVDGTVHQHHTWAQNNQEAELLAAQFALTCAPAGTGITLHTDNVGVERLWHTDWRAKPLHPLRPWTLALRGATRARQQRVRFQHLPSAMNPAHELTRPATPPPAPPPTVKLHQTPLTMHVRGAGLNIDLPAQLPVGLHALLEIARHLPPCEQDAPVLVRGCGPLTQLYWNSPHRAPSDLRVTVILTRDLLAERQRRLVLLP